MRGFTFQRAGLALLPLLVAAGMAACGDDSGGKASPTAPAAGPGTVTITSSSAIMGQANRMLLVYAAPQAGGQIIAEACIQITNDRFTIPAAVMTTKQGDQAPCSGSAPKASLPEGTYTLTAGVYAPPAQKAGKEITLTVQVKGDVTVPVDGAQLSK